MVVRNKSRGAKQSRIRIKRKTSVKKPSNKESIKAKTPMKRSRGVAKGPSASTKKESENDRIKPGPSSKRTKQSVVKARPPARKHLCIFFDGTSRGHSAGEPTNVAKACRLLSSANFDGEPQIVCYIDGIGIKEPRIRGAKSYDANLFQTMMDVFNNGQLDSTGFAEQAVDWLQSALGVGAVGRLLRAYEFLVWNYDPGDNIYLFGFSRGAYTARAFVQMLRYCGIVSREHLDQTYTGPAIFIRSLKEGIDDNTRGQLNEIRRRYSEASVRGGELKDRQDKGSLCVVDSKNEFSIRYLGLWDTVAATFEDTGEAKKKGISRCVESYRHALALNEDDEKFAPRIISNTKELNEAHAKCQRHGANYEHYQQHWFPGDHGCVGGGTDNTYNLANMSLCWVLFGAAAAGLDFEWNSPFGEEIESTLHFDNHHCMPDGDYVRTTKRRARLIERLSSEADIAKAITPSPIWGPYANNYPSFLHKRGDAAKNLEGKFFGDLVRIRDNYLIQKPLKERSFESLAELFGDLSIWHELHLRMPEKLDREQHGLKSEALA